LVAKRGGLHTLNGARGFAIDDAGRLGSLEEGVLLGDPLLLHLDIAVEEKAREPAATDRDAVFRQDRAQLGHVHREAAAGFHAGEARDRGLAQAFLQAHVIAEFRQVVVPPGDRGNSKFRFHLIRPCSSNSDTLLGADLRSGSHGPLFTLSRSDTSGTPTSQSASPGTQA
jgi:hypothetical protein